jgi:hypothetical protein
VNLYKNITDYHAFILEGKEGVVEDNGLQVDITNQSAAFLIFLHAIHWKHYMYNKNLKSLN